MIGLAASVSPFAVAGIVAALSGRRPYANAVAFIAAYTSVLLLMGLGGAALFKLQAMPKISPHTEDVVLIVLGLLAGYVAFRPRHHQRQSWHQPTITNPMGAAKLGAGLMAINSSTLLIFITGLGAINADAHSLLNYLLLLTVLVAVTNLTLVVPMAVYLLAPRRAAKLLTELREVLYRHSRVVGRSLLTIIGLYAIIKGTAGLLS